MHRSSEISVHFFNDITRVVRMLVLSNDQIENIGPESIENRTPSATLTMLLGPYFILSLLINNYPNLCSY